MCWVMPPASPDTTLAWRSASSSEVLPWSTWPITVTTGERGSVSVELSTASNRPSSTSEAATRLTVWPSSSAISCAVSASITSVILCIAPCFISRRMTSTARSDMRLASSWILMASGITTSRISFSFGSFEAWPFRRWVRRRNEAIERSRTSSALSAVTSVSRPRCFCGDGLAVVFGGGPAPPGPPGADAAGAATDLARTFVFIGNVGGDTGGAGGGQRGAGCGCGLGLGFAEAFLGLEFGLALGFLVRPVALFLGLAAGFGGLALGLLDAFLAVAALGFLFGELPLFHVADFGVGERAGACRTLILGQRAQHHARTAARRGRRRRRTGERRLGGRCCRGRGLGEDRLGGMRFRCGRIAADAALAALFNHDLLGAAVAEALLHGARLDARLERQGLVRDTQFPVARRFINHSAVLILFKWCVSAPSVSANSWSRGRPSCRRPPSGIGPGAGCATGTSCSPGPRAGQHVSHLTGPM